MNTTLNKLQKLADEYYNQFTTIKRGDDTIYTLKNEVHNDSKYQRMTFKAHGDMMPDDYRYAYIVEALGALRDYDDPDDAENEIEPDIYNSDLTAWLHSRNDRYAYVDEAMAEMGPGSDTMQNIMMGQIQEKREVFGIVRQWLENEIEEGGDDDI